MKKTIKELVNFLITLRKYSEALSFIFYLDELYIKDNNFDMARKCTKKADVVLAMTEFGTNLISSYLG